MKGNYSAVRIHLYEDEIEVQLKKVEVTSLFQETTARFPCVNIRLKK